MKVKFYIFAVIIGMAAVFSGCKDDPIPPTVATKPASGIAEGVATLNAEITNPGSDAITSCGFYYNTSSDMSYPEVVNANLGDSRFSAQISNLEPGKTYYYMAFAKSSAGLAEGETLSFATQAVRPSVETRPVSEVTTSGATLNAAISGNGGSEITACGFYYSTSESMSNKQTAEFSGTPDSLFSVAVSGLQSFTTYYYKAFATNALGTAEGEVMQFTTVIKPSVTTNAATDLHSASATLNGNVTNHGGTTSTIRGFVYGTSAENLTDSVTSGTGSGAYSKEIAGLTPSTSYYFKAFASNSAGTVYGAVKQFTTKVAAKPTVTTNNASSITSTGATLSGNITAAGSDPVTIRGFVYGTSTSNLSNNVEVGSGTGSFTKEITGLAHSTTYYYKAYATNAAGTSYGQVKSFATTTLTAPTVQTNAASSISMTGATLNGNVTADGGATVTARGFVYGTSASNLSQNVQSGSGTGSFTKALTGLSHSTTYYYKAYATNAIGTNYGEVKQFTTSSPSMPTVQTNAATSISMTGATLNGNVTADGGATVTVRGFVYGTSASNLSQNVQSGTGTGSFTKALTGLSHSTTYYYKAYATNAIGTNYGEVKQFTTSSPSMPTVQTNNASSITSSGATLNGNVTADGGATVTVRGFVYGTSASDLSQNVQSGSGTGNFTKALTGLTRSTTYYYKAYATNSAGTAYGEVKTFTTISDGKIDALYSVSSTSKVYFSKGNLSYQSGTWSFVESQLEYGSYFCYGTGNNPVITSYSYHDYPTFTDWGTNPISNGGNIPNQWRTLSKDEWDYLLFTRTTTSNIRYAMAIVNGVAGVILLPDNWNSSYYPLNSTNTTNAAFSVNTISPLGWSLIEASGAVFLPAAGENYYGMLHVGEWGHYWSKTGYNGIEGAYILRFYNNNLQMIQSSRGRGESVRLVMDE